MTIRFSPLLFHSILRTICLAFLLNVSAVFAADYVGPVFPDGVLIDTEYAEPLPLPKRNPLLHRSASKQVVFDDLDPVDSVIPQNLLYDDEMDIRSQAVHQRQTSRRIPSVIDNGNFIFTDGGEMIEDGIFGDYPFEMDSCVTGPFPVPYGMGLFDNITLFSEAATFKTGLNGRGGSFGLNEGINWSTAVTPQGAVTAQYGVRAVQGDFSAEKVRSQLFMTVGLFKRFDCIPVQGGVAVDWLEDRSIRGPVNLRQMRCELSTRSFGPTECGFIGGLNVFRDRPTIQYVDLFWDIDVHDYYLLFARKYLDCGGQVELRCGSTAHGDFIMHALGEVAVTDRVAVNGGFSVLAPGRETNVPRNLRESWSMSLGVVIYFRGGAAFRQMNSHRQMFDVAGNNSFLTRIRNL